jgi:hypothetical protein
MRFISKYGRLQVQVRPQITEAYASGAIQVTQPQVLVQFDPTLLRIHERDLALKTWHFDGMYQEMDEATPVPPDYRIGAFDSVLAAVDNGWSEEVQRDIERKLSEQAERYPHIIVAPLTSVPPPWPRYDAYGGSPTALVRKVIDEGHDLEQVLAYERESLQRAKVIELLQAALAGEANAELEEEGVVLG